MIDKKENGLLFSCDTCSNQQFIEETDYRKAHNKLKEEHGWFSRKLDEEWYNFCCEDCYQDKVLELEKLYNQKQADKLNPEKNPDWKIATFEDELNLIKVDEVRNMAKKLVNQIPNYFFKVAASSTGRFHSKYTQGVGGLVRHTKAAVRIGAELLRLDMYADLQKFRDLIIIALLLHDSFKHGKLDESGEYSMYSEFTHPLMAAEFIKNSKVGPDIILNFIASLVETHMGQWTTNYRSNKKELEEPKTEAQKFVHLCDYLASRKCIEYDSSIPFSET